MIEKNCGICGEKFLTTPSRIKVGKGKYCSNKCRHVAKSRSMKGVKCGKVLLTCSHCGAGYKVFPSRVARSRYCSKACFANALAQAQAGSGNHSWRGGGKRVCCVVCNKEFQVPESKNAKYCSTTCKAKAQRKPKARLTCDICGRKFLRFPSEVEKSASRGHSGTYCGVECRGKAQGLRQSGENNPQWRGGVTPENHLIRSSKRMNEWRRSVFARDDFTCQGCGVRNRKGHGKTVKLHAHHIKGFAEYPELRFDVSNGLTLCLECHIKVHHRPDEFGKTEAITEGA